jgi:hypothetical protein
LKGQLSYMSANVREIVRQTPTHPDMKIAADDRWAGRWMINMGSPIGLSEYTGSRFVGKFPDDVLPAKSPIFFAPHAARATGLYEHKAITGSQADMAVNLVDDMMSIPVNSGAQGTLAPITRYDNNPKLCAYMLMRDYERRGLCLFETVKGMDEADFLFLYDLIIPPHIEKEWRKTKRAVLDHEFRGPFLYQFKEWLGVRGDSPMQKWYNANIRELHSHGLDRQQTDKHGAMITALREAVDRAWKWESSSLNDSEAAIRAKRNGEPGKRFYDMPDERFVNPVPPLDLICLVDLNRTPMDLQQMEAAGQMGKATSESIVEGMKGFATELASKMAPQPQTSGVTVEDVEQLLAIQREQMEKEAAEREAVWQARVEALLNPGAAVQEPPPA